MKYCKHCGNSCEDSNKFCESCGANLEAESAAPQTPQVNVVVDTADIHAQATLTDTDKTLRMIAFVFNCISIASSCWLIIPLAWMIPMTVVSWGIYKGTRKNTVAFGICNLIFLNIVGGILLLCSSKDE